MGETNRVMVVRKFNLALFDELHWVAAATAKNDVRDYLNSIRVTDFRIEATDGHRLHRVDFPEEAGPGVPHVLDGEAAVPLHNANWNVEKRTKTTIHLVRAPECSFTGWPVTDRVVPSDSDDTLAQGTVRDDGPGREGDAYTTLHHELLWVDNESFFTLPYFKDAVAGREGVVQTWKFCDTLGPLTLRSEFEGVKRVAVIMPCRRAPGGPVLKDYVEAAEKAAA